ncbi:MAG TPA: AraC family transcriptional regulator [Thermoanaerobaculia bacterium]|nr:AraC family transcriptional regulator [Thermoanaerobaculia bacterium]
MKFQFAVNPRWPDLPNCSALLHGHPRDYNVYNYRTTLSIKSVRRGAAWYETHDGRYLVTPDVFLVLNEGQHYSMEVDASANTETYCPFFQPGFVRAGEIPERLYPMRGRIAAALRSFGGVPIEDSFFDLAEGLTELRDDARRESISFPGLRASTREEMYRRLYRARDFLHCCFAEPVSVSDAAAIAAMSPFHFQRMFKIAFGITPMQFVQRRRLERARQLLIQTDEPVTAVCLSVGFESLGSFSTLFKRTFGLSPREVRSRDYADPESSADGP